MGAEEHKDMSLDDGFLPTQYVEEERTDWSLESDVKEVTLVMQVKRRLNTVGNEGQYTVWS